MNARTTEMRKHSSLFACWIYRNEGVTYSNEKAKWGLRKHWSSWW